MYKQATISYHKHKYNFLKRFEGLHPSFSRSNFIVIYILHYITFSILSILKGIMFVNDGICDNFAIQNNNKYILLYRADRMLRGLSLSY